MTPVLTKILNLDPRKRSCFGAHLLLGTFKIDLFCNSKKPKLFKGLFPKKVEFAKMLELVLRSREHCWLKAVDRGGSRCDRGFKVRDGYDKSERIMFFTVAIIGPEDTRGLPRQLHMSQAPAIVGGCTLCVIIGCSCINLTIYACAVTYTRRDSPLRERLRLEFGSPLLVPPPPVPAPSPPVPPLLSSEPALVAGEKQKKPKRTEPKISPLVQLHLTAHKVCLHMRNRSGHKPPRRWTTTLAKQSALRMKNGANPKHEAFKAGTDAYTALVPDFDKMAAADIDLAHELAHLASHLLGIMANTAGSTEASPKRMFFEELLGRGKRFEKIGSGKQRHYPFQSSTQCGIGMENAMRTYRLPRGRPNMRRPFTRSGSMKLVTCICT